MLAPLRVRHQTTHQADLVVVDTIRHAGMGEMGGIGGMGGICIACARSSSVAPQKNSTTLDIFNRKLKSPNMKQ